MAAGAVNTTRQRPLGVATPCVFYPLGPFLPFVLLLRVSTDELVDGTGFQALAPSKPASARRGILACIERLSSYQIIRVSLRCCIRTTRVRSLLSCHATYDVVLGAPDRPFRALVNNNKRNVPFDVSYFILNPRGLKLRREIGPGLFTVQKIHRESTFYETERKNTTRLRKTTHRRLPSHRNTHQGHTDPTQPHLFSSCPPDVIPKAYGRGG